MSWSDLRDLFVFARNRLHEERLSQVAGSLTYTTVLALVPILTIALAIFTTFPAVCRKDYSSTYQPISGVCKHANSNQFR